MFIRRHNLFALLIALIVFAVYAQTASYEFLRFDDQDYTFFCPFVKDGFSWTNVKAAFTTFTHAAIWMPLTYISYMLDISLFGPGSGAHHLVNAAIHAVNSGLFYLLLVGLFGESGKLRVKSEELRVKGEELRVEESLPKLLTFNSKLLTLNSQLLTFPTISHHLVIILSTLFWALHPMRVEPVAWIAGRKELLCAFFVLLGLLAVARRRFDGLMVGWFDGSERSNPSTSESSPTIKLSNHQTIKPFLCCIAACMSKPTGMCFPFLALCVSGLVKFESLKVGKSESLKVGKSKAGSLLNFQLFNFSTFQLLPVALATGLIAIYSQTHAKGYDVRTLFTAPFSTRALNALKSLGLYMFKTFVPFDLHIDCRWPTPDLPAEGWGAIIAAIVGLLLLAMWLASSKLKVKSEELRVKVSLPKLLTLNSKLLTLNSQLLTLLFFLFAIAPTLGVFGSFGREARADRFMYIPSMAISILLAACASRIGRDGARPTRSRQSTTDNRQSVSHLKTFQLFNFSTFQLLILVSIYALSTLRLIPSFRNTYTAFSRVLVCDPIHPRALSQVASEEGARFHDFDSGIRHFRDSLACEWNRSTACQLAFALATRGRREDIPDIRALGESTGIAKHPESDRKGLMCEALGMSALKERRWLDAVPFFTAAVRASARLHPPDDAFARLGVALANGGRRDEAKQVFAALARPGAARESVRAFAERSLEQLASSTNGQIMLFY